MVSRISDEQVACFWREAQSSSVEELAAPAWSHLVLILEVLECNPVLLRLRLQAPLEVLVKGPLVVLLEMSEPQRGIQAVHLKFSFLLAQPLPPSMNSLCVQDMIRS